MRRKLAMSGGGAARQHVLADRDSNIIPNDRLRRRPWPQWPTTSGRSSTCCTSTATTPTCARPPTGSPTCTSRCSTACEEGAEPEITTFPNEEHYSSMVMERDIPFYSMCAHHFVPFYGHAHIAYIPEQRIVGLSKIPRILEFYAKRPQIQERLTEQVADYLWNGLDPLGAMVVIEARHLCVEMRGVKKPGALTVTSAIRGCFEECKVREEFLSFLGRRKEW